MPAQVRCLVLVACTSLAMWAQQPSTGVETAWDARKLVADAVKSDQDLRPLLQAINPQEWQDKKGAPGSYMIQWQSARDQIRYVEIAAGTASQHIDGLSGMLELYYRMEALESTARSVNEGALQYASRPDAEKLSQWVGRAFDARRRMRDYIQDLATSLEQNFKVADEEAQRCRGMITKTPPAPGRRSTTK